MPARRQAEIPIDEKNLSNEIHGTAFFMDGFLKFWDQQEDLPMIHTT